MFDFYRFCIHLFGLMLISQKNIVPKGIVLFFAVLMKKEKFLVKQMLQIPDYDVKRLF